MNKQMVVVGKRIGGAWTKLYHPRYNRELLGPLYVADEIQRIRERQAMDSWRLEYYSRFQKQEEVE